MKALSAENWSDLNQRYLSQALAVIRQILEHAVRTRDKPDTHIRETASEDDLQRLAAEMSPPPALQTLCKAFGLSHFERDLLLLCAGVELDAKFLTILARAQDDRHRFHPTFSLAFAIIPGAHWSALTKAAPLRRWNLISVGEGDVLTLSPLSIEERVLHYLTGLSCTDARLEGIISPIPSPRGLPESHRTLARYVADIWARESFNVSPALIQISGSETDQKRSIAASACAIVGLKAYAMRGNDIPNQPAEREALARLWEREAVLDGAALLVECDDMEVGDLNRSVFPFIESIYGPVLIASRDPLRLGRRRTITLEVKRPNAQEQRLLWQENLGHVAYELKEPLERILAQFDLSARTIESASEVTLARLPLNPKDKAPSMIWDACRVQTRAKLEGLAQRIEPKATWSDLVLPDPQIQVLKSISTHCAQRTKVYETWGFANKVARGLGISALFAGTSGTGKTMAAEVLANELELDLYRIDLSQVVSKYIGETEKNLRRVFDASESGAAILLFDEADALFGKRSEVKDSHDRYANIEISYLLQRMETYRGITILTTNMKEALDPAFLRRIRFIVHFPFPDVTDRAKIWRRIFPQATPTEQLDFERFARLNVAGGSIRNIAMNAAFLAAHAGEQVRTPHIIQAARTEYAKLEKTLTESEIGG